MATLVPYTSLSASQRIDGVDCLGDSRAILNSNFQNIETFVHSLSTTALKTTTVSTHSSRNTPTTYTRSLSVYNAAGAYIGFIPIYN